MSALRLGLLGGTFDPPHLGHLLIASDACDALALDRVVFIPAAAPPHKPGRVQGTPEQRLAMVRAAISGDPRFAADDMELRRAGPSYTVDTLRALRERHPGAELFFLVGVDQLRELHSWKDPDEVARLATLAVVAREGREVPPETPYPVLPVQVTRVDVSSTLVRRRVAEGRPIRYLVPEAVREMIEREGLYR